MSDIAQPVAVPVTLTYTNWRGETAERTIIPQSVWFGSTDWHPEPQWLLKAIDTEKGAERDFALKDFGAPPADAQAAPDDLDNRPRYSMARMRDEIRKAEKRVREEERERCAKVAEDFDEDTPGHFDRLEDPGNAGASWASEKIAAAIRQPSTGDER